MTGAQRPGCPINLTLELLGDRWNLIVLRDLMFAGSKHYRELLARSEEHVASNILADRLERLTQFGRLSRHADPSYQQKGIYRLTDASIQLEPRFAQMGAW